MAIYSHVPPPAAIDGNVEQLQLQSLHISPAGVTLAIPLDDEIAAQPKTPSAGAVEKKRKERERRDSMKRREALLKGKEGSRRRQRWENDRLLHVPNAQPPLPADWAPRATHRVSHIPYYLAPLWDVYRAEEEAEMGKKQKKKNAPRAESEARGRVPSDLKTKLKKSKGAKSLLQDLEREVRAFLAEVEVEEDDEDEEIVFIGRDKDGKGITMSDEVERSSRGRKVVYEGLAGCPGESFKRWLVHSLAGYYGLSSWSETTAGRPAKRGVWVGVRERERGGCGTSASGPADMPRPLWGMV